MRLMATVVRILSNKRTVRKRFGSLMAISMEASGVSIVASIPQSFEALWESHGEVRASRGRSSGCRARHLTMRGLH